MLMWVLIVGSIALSIVMARKNHMLSKPVE